MRILIILILLALLACVCVILYGLLMIWTDFDERLRKIERKEETRRKVEDDGK